MTRALVPLARGVEEMEAVIVIDTLRRAGWEVVSAGLVPGEIVASRGVRLIADQGWDAIDPDAFDALVLPGGRDGTNAMAADSRVLETVRRFVASGRLVAALCAAPLVLQAAGVLGGRRATCHPGVQGELTAARLQKRRRVVIDGSIVTSQGPGTAFEFALALVRARGGDADAVARAMVFRKG